jgi:hypothetical protein
MNANGVNFLMLKRILFIPVVAFGLSCNDGVKRNSKTYESPFAAYTDSLPVADRQVLYKAILRRLEKKRERLQNKWAAANSEASKQKILNETRSLLLSTLCDSLFVCWYGTGWDFNGVTEKPGEGNIACGYFVTTALRDAGFKIDRVYFAQQASSVMINAICNKNKIWIHGNSKPVEEANRFNTREEGLYIIGLDNHVGFVKKKKEKVSLVHSCPWPNHGVGVEEFAKSAIINESHYFMTGNLLGTDETIISWILGKKIGD